MRLLLPCVPQRDSFHFPSVAQFNCVHCFEACETKAQPGLPARQTTNYDPLYSNHGASSDSSENCLSVDLFDSVKHRLLAC